MRSRLHILTHPLHPILVVFPTAIFPLMLLLDVVELATGNDLAAAGIWLAGVGLVTTLAAAVPGIVDYRAVPDRTIARRVGLLHFATGVLVALAYAVMVGLYWPVGSDPALGARVALSAVGTVLITAQGWLGGELVYKHHLAVLSREEGAVPTPWKERAAAPPEREPVGGPGRV